MVATDDYSHHLLDDDLPPERLGGQVFDAVGGPILISSQWKGLWHQFKTVLGVTASDGSNLADKIANRERAVREKISSYTDRGELERDLDRAELPWGVVRSMHEVLDSPTLKATEVYAEVDDRGAGTRKVIQAPYAFSDADSGIRGPAPHRGEHNAEVLDEWLSLPRQQIEALEKAKVLLRDEEA